MHCVKDFTLIIKPMSAYSLQPTYTILGLSKTGISAARYLQTRGANCFLSESLAASPLNQAERESLQALGVTVEMGGHSRRCFSHADTIIVSPGIPPTASIIRELTLSGKTLMSDVELAWLCQPKLPWVGITGTNGKTTTTSLISAILQANGRQAPACGNIGLPFLDVLHAGTPDAMVAELSSYQLERTHHFKATVGVFLNLTPDHLDWHGGLDAYQNAKLGFLTGKRSPQTLVFRADEPLAARLRAQTQSPVCYPFSLNPACVANDTCAVTLIDGNQITLKTPNALMPVVTVDRLTLIGPHNVENVMAAIAATYALGVNVDTIRQACEAFQAVPHRLEYVTTINGCAIYNDSKATNPEATMSALTSFPPDKPVVLLAGGKDKNGPLDAFTQVVKDRVSSVVLFGEAAERFEQALKPVTQVFRATTLEDAVKQALNQAHQQPVVFSPACASFDMFRHFEDRGDQFKALIQSLSHAGLAG
jgi:UDP-N-acetylmuramoylalanine--D-glutamate ligase